MGQVVHGTVMKQKFSTYRGWSLDGTDWKRSTVISERPHIANLRQLVNSQCFILQLIQSEFHQRAVIGVTYNCSYKLHLLIRCTLIRVIHVVAVCILRSNFEQVSHSQMIKGPAKLLSRWVSQRVSCPIGTCISWKLLKSKFFYRLYEVLRETHRGKSVATLNHLTYIYFTAAVGIC